MTFRNYLQEKNSSEKILSFIQNHNLPVSPKFFEDTFNQKEKTCFISFQPERIADLTKLQNTKKSISTFTKFRDTEIFWGAEGINWKTSSTSPNYETCVAVLKGKYTLQGSDDLWSNFDQAGRRWLVLDNLTEFKVFDKIRTELIKGKEKILNQGFVNITRNELITQYMDLSYSLIKKYHKELLSFQEQEPKYGYNEVLCYEYKIKKIFFITKDIRDTARVFKYDIKRMKKYDFEYIEVKDDILGHKMGEILSKKLKGLR